VDTGAVDTGAVGKGAVDAGAVDAGAVDTGAVDTGAADTGAEDTGATDTGGGLGAVFVGFSVDNSSARANVDNSSAPPGESVADFGVDSNDSPSGFEVVSPREERGNCRLK